jgi:hypothetical protein
MPGMSAGKQNKSADAPQAGVAAAARADALCKRRVQPPDEPQYGVAAQRGTPAWSGLALLPCMQ